MFITETASRLASEKFDKIMIRLYARTIEKSRATSEFLSQNRRETRLSLITSIHLFRLLVPSQKKRIQHSGKPEIAQTFLRLVYV